jgi:hypothetical protein
VSRSQALALYASATETGEGWREAAEALMAALSPPKKARDLHAPVKVGRRSKFWGSFLVTWADGSATKVTGVIWDKPEDREAAAYQAANRLRRYRARHGWEGHPGAPTRWERGMCGIQRETARWWTYVRCRELPPLAKIESLEG